MGIFKKLLGTTSEKEVRALADQLDPEGPQPHHPVGCLPYGGEGLRENVIQCLAVFKPLTARPPTLPTLPMVPTTSLALTTCGTTWPFTPASWSSGATPHGGEGLRENVIQCLAVFKPLFKLRGLGLKLRILCVYLQI